MEFCLRKKTTRKSGVRRMDENGVRVIGYCVECDTQITDDMEDVYVDDYGNYFCGFECIADHFELHKLEF